MGVSCKISKKEIEREEEKERKGSLEDKVKLELIYN